MNKNLIISTILMVTFALLALVGCTNASSPDPSPFVTVPITGETDAGPEAFTLTMNVDNGGDAGNTVTVARIGTSNQFSVMVTFAQGYTLQQPTQPAGLTMISQSMKDGIVTAIVELTQNVTYSLVFIVYTAPPPEQPAAKYNLTYGGTTFSSVSITRYQDTNNFTVIANGVPGWSCPPPNTGTGTYSIQFNASGGWPSNDMNISIDGGDVVLQDS